MDLDALSQLVAELGISARIAENRRPGCGHRGLGWDCLLERPDGRQLELEGLVLYDPDAAVRDGEEREVVPTPARILAFLHPGDLGPEPERYDPDGAMREEADELRAFVGDAAYERIGELCR